MWTKGVPVEQEAHKQIVNVAELPIVHPHVAVMPDVHVGKGAVVGAVIPCLKAIIPAAVGVDIGCGMIASRTTLTANDLPNSLRPLRLAIEEAIPHGRTSSGGPNDKGSWRTVPKRHSDVWRSELQDGFRKIVSKHPKLKDANTFNHLGTLGTGNHFIELCLDESNYVWLMLHSGSRGIGNRIGTYFIEMAKKDMKKHLKNLPDADLAYLEEGTEHFKDYVFAVQWAQQFAKLNRMLMMESFLKVLKSKPGLPEFTASLEAVNCHHNYVSKEHHFGQDLYVTRKGALSARKDELGIIPGSMGAKSYIVRGLGNADSFHSCSHGAGRVHSRGAAKKLFTMEDHINDTQGVECRHDLSVLDETPKAYKDIEAVITAQVDLVEIVHTLKQVLCVKG